MPCGGIFPIGHTEGVDDVEHGGKCWTCGKSEPVPDLFVVEWDAYLHRACLGKFLASEEGQIVLDHKHAIVVPEGD